ncbi:MAG TPA: hypothetical protein VGJ09_07070, partial [Bryobacteraceae bacterium]
MLVSADEAWKDKKIAEWNETDAKQVLSDSPWVKTVTPSVSKPASDSPRRSGMGRGGGIGVGGVGISLPGMGRRGGIGGPGTGGGGYPRGGQTSDPNGGSGGNSNTTPTLMLRWESALPVREAELKARETDAPTLDEDHYAIAVYGVPDRIGAGNSDQLKKQATIKRDGKKDLKPSSVQVLQRDEGKVIVYLFPRTKEIGKDDR